MEEREELGIFYRKDGKIIIVMRSDREMGNVWIFMIRENIFGGCYEKVRRICVY